MKSLNNIIDRVVDILSEEKDFPYAVKTVFNSTLLDIPISTPTVTVGINEAEFKLGALSLYSGLYSESENYSVPVELALSANIYLPNAANGVVNFETLSYVVLALAESDLPVSRITCGSIRYDSTLMCSVLPVKIHLSEHIY